MQAGPGDIETILTTPSAMTVAAAIDTTQDLLLTFVLVVLLAALLISAFTKK